jgi:hypothetical protein
MTSVSTPCSIDAVRRFDHVFLDVRPEAVLRAKDRRQDGLFVRGDAVGGVDELVVHGRGIAHDADATPAKRASGEQAFGSKLYAHAAIISQGSFQPGEGAS